MVIVMSVERWWNGTDWGVWSVGGMVLTGKQKYLEKKTSPSTTLYTINFK
jgi:hypothetical protein